MKFNEYVYERPNLEENGMKLVEIAKKLDGLTDYEKAVSLIEEAMKIDSYVSSMYTISSIRNSINTVDKFYEDEDLYFNENLPKYQTYTTLYNKALVNSPIRAKLEEKYGKQWFNVLEMNLKAFDEKIVPELIEEGKLVTEYSKLIASAKIEFDGKINNLSQMSVYANSLDRNVRKEAEYKKVEFLAQVEDKVDEIYDKLVKVRTTMAKKMGYDNYVDFGYLRLGRSDYNAADVANYRKQVYEEIVPVAKKIIEDQKNRIGISDMKAYDLPIFYLSGNPTPKGNKDELVNKALKMYKELSPETGDFFNMMIENGLMDLETKPNKRGGGYCTMISMYKSPFIFSNFNGTMGDVDVLTHEAGHAFECYTASKYLEVNDIIWPTLEACEIHSMSMEFFAHPWMELFFEGDADKYRYKHLAESITFIPYGVCVDEFQHFVYENPDASPKERKEKWSSLEKKYTPWKDFDGIKYYEDGAYWHRQAHIFSTAFYYIDYTLAQVCAFQYFLKDLDNHEAAWNNYYKLCTLGGSMSFTNLLDKVGLENPFNDGSLHKIMSKLDVVTKELASKVNE